MYPPFREKGLRFVDLASPGWFENDPELAWGFYGHRLELYRRTVPHRGFHILRKLAERTGRFLVFTCSPKCGALARPNILMFETDALAYALARRPSGGTLNDSRSRP